MLLRALAVALSAVVAFAAKAHFALYQTALFWACLGFGIHRFSNYSWAMSAICAGEIVGGFWIVQGISALMENKFSRRRSLD